MTFFRPFLAILTAYLTALSLAAAPAAGDAPPPDFTKGDALPQNAPHDWNLGATGLRGWMHTHRFVTYDARQIYVTAVDPGSPAEGLFQVGDVILGVGGSPFSQDPRTEFGMALTAAESVAGGGRLALTRWRAGKADEVTLQLKVLGDYGPTAPFDCPKSKEILRQGSKVLAESVRQSAERQNPIVRSLNAMALLAIGDPAHADLIKREAAWAAAFTTDGYHTWYYGYVMMFLSEYVIATDDVSALPGLRRMALEAAQGQSDVGSWGHRFARDDGRLFGYGMMNSPGIPLTISLVLAKTAGVKDPEIDRAIRKSCDLLRFYVGKGAIPYGDHPAWTQTHEDNGKCGMGAVLFHLLGDKEAATYFSRMAVASHGAERDGGHTGNFFNLLWSMPGVALSGPQATGTWMQGFGSWYFDLARRPDGSFVHLGPPEPKNDSYHDWDCTGLYLLAYAMPLRKIHLTGKTQGTVAPLDPAAAKSIFADGKGWDDKNRNGFYDSLTDRELLDRLSSWSPIVRERAAAALSRRPQPPMADILKLLDSSGTQTLYGACHALALLGSRSSAAVDPLIALLSHDDYWMRVQAAQALAGIGRDAVKAAPKMLELMTTGDPEKDPRNMQQRYLSFALFDRGRGLLGQSLDGIDRDALYRAVRAGLRNQDGHARGTMISVFDKLSFEELRPLFPAIAEAVRTPAPSGEMFADEIRLGGCRLLAKHRVKEGMELCVRYTREQNPWSSQNRTPEIMKLLLSYGAHAQAWIPELEEIAHYFEKEEPDFPADLMAMKAKCVRDTIAAIRASTEKPELKSIR
ncbi:MAG: DUF6288 domain-containing protein [Akkermansiaceae bacterium]|jgi:hypothetical protein|nr:DUF6288 domain-containing protein [Akkermansiaceae bacterium]